MRIEDTRNSHYSGWEKGSKDEPSPSCIWEAALTTETCGDSTPESRRKNYSSCTVSPAPPLTKLNIMPKLPRWRSGEESTRQYRRHRRCGFNPWVGKLLWRRKWQPTPVFLPGKFHGQRSLAGYNPQGGKELDTNTGTHTQHHAQSKGDHCGLCRNIRASLVENPMRCNQSSPPSTQLEGRPMGSKEDPPQTKIRIS